MGALYGNSIYSGTISGGGYYMGDTTASATTITIHGNDYGALAWPTPSKPKPETNLDWLDKRVNEMRVAL